MDFHTYFGDRCATDLLLRVVLGAELERGQELVRHREERALGPAEVPARVADGSHAIFMNRLQE